MDPIYKFSNPLSPFKPAHLLIKAPRSLFKSDWPAWNFMHCRLIMEWLVTIQSLTKWKLWSIFWIFDIEWCRVFAGPGACCGDLTGTRQTALCWERGCDRHLPPDIKSAWAWLGQRQSEAEFENNEPARDKVPLCPLPSPSQTASDSSGPRHSHTLTWKLDIQWTHLHKILHFPMEPWPKSVTGMFYLQIPFQACYQSCFNAGAILIFPRLEPIYRESLALFRALNFNYNVSTHGLTQSIFSVEKLYLSPRWSWAVRV